MASQTVNLTAGQSSAPIAVTPLKLVGIDTDKPVRIATAAGSQLTPQTSGRHALIVVAPTASIVITAGPEGASVSVTTPDA